MRRWIGLLFLTLVAGVLPFSLSVTAQATDWSALIQRAQPAIVWIVVDVPEGRSFGSGAIVSPDGYILTAAHVVEDATRITVWVEDARDYRATLVRADHRADVALLKISASGLTWLAVGDSAALTYEEDLRGLGYPRATDIGVGFIPARGYFIGLRVRPEGTYVQFEASPVDQGHSGGPLINARGEIVGVMVWIFGRPELGVHHKLAASTSTARAIISSGVLPTGPSPVQPATGPGPALPVTVVRVPQDQPTIAAAVGVAAEGAEIQLSRGTHRGDVSITKPLTISGESGATIEGSVRISARNVTLRGVRIIGGVEIRDSTSFALDGVTVASSPADAILIEASTGVIAGCVIEDAVGSGVVSSFSSRVSISATTVRRSAKGGIVLFLGSQVRITDCVIAENRGDGISVAGSAAHIQDTTVRGNMGCGIRADAGSTVSGSASNANTRDNGGGNLCGTAFTLDLEPPTIRARIEPEPNAEGWNSSDVRVAFDCADPLTGIATCAEPQLVSQEGVHEVTGEAVDRAGNRASATATVRLDWTPPTGSVQIDGGATTTPSGTVSLRIVGTDARSGVGEMRFSNDGRTWSPWETYATARAGWDLTRYGGALTEGAKTVQVQLRDRAGNISAAFSASITLVASASPLPAPRDLRATPSGWSNAASFAVDWDDPAQIPPRAAAWYKVGAPPQGPDDGTRLEAKPIHVTATADGEHLVYVWLEDEAGRKDPTQWSTVTLRLDRAPPIGLVSINAGAATTTNPVVTLTVSAADALSGVAEMRFSNDGTTWSSWEPFATSRPKWDLTLFGGSWTEGAKTVHGQVRDRAGNASAAFASSIRYAIPPAPPGMVYIPGGSFRMGDPFNEGATNERPVHTVTVSAFYMDVYEVTKALWDEVAAWAQANGYDIGPSDGSGKAPNHPVYNVSWYEAVKWANARSEREGRTPAYYTSAAKTTVYRTGRVDVQTDWVRWDTGYRLPTEAEWEKAARGGCEGRRFPWCDADTITHSRANYQSRVDHSYDTSPTRGYHPTYTTGSQPYTSPVGSFAPNGYGLYDMAGNVWEWCWDWSAGGYYASSPGTDPRGPASGTTRALRGGGWSSEANRGRVAHRASNRPDIEYLNLGFRAVLPPGP